MKLNWEREENTAAITSTLKKATILCISAKRMNSKTLHRCVEALWAWGQWGSCKICTTALPHLSCVS